MSADLISGRLGGDQFPAQVLGRAHRRYAANADQTTDFAHLLTWPDLNQLLATRRLDVPRMRLSDGQTVDVGQYTRPRTYRRMPNWNAPVPHLFHEQLRQGATLVVDAIDEMHPPINTMAAELEAWLGTRVQVNAYASWTAKEGFGVHWDDHDVIVLQVSGRKRWRIYGTTRQAPLYSDVEVDDDAPTEPVDEFTMEPGDVLHVPRGCWHAASASEGEPSLHLTCGLNTTTGADFLDWVNGLMREHVEVRSDVPRNRGDQAAWTYRLAELITQRLQSPGVVEEYWDHLNQTAPARMAFSLPVAVTGTLSASSRLRLASHRGTVSEENGQVVLSAQGRRWRLAPVAAPVLHRLADHEPVTVKELCRLAPEISEDALISLLRRLMDDGALVWEGEE
ncbi:cupin domain-containing protein [Nocardiopsis sp. NRRL B-16309]|uniref:cupin domain-containing protein n=1 Tax=Nocardiopsis sp. NRRL B-16309 TaxID=1519494 RepID=UPI0006AE37CA|nr:cupin domain-containing protein [Nocardiopsis sp. NRRL B-16309]